MNRDQIIGAAFRKVVSLQTLTPAQILVATEHLNTIMQEEDAICASKQQPALWATVRDALPLKTARQVYTTTGPNSTYPISSGLLELIAVSLRDAGGQDVPVEIVNADQWQRIGDKEDTGDTLYVWLEENTDLAQQRLWVHPIPTDVTDPSEVVGTDGATYVCIQSHSASSPKRPTTGAQWPAYWVQKTQIGTPAAWSASASYTAAPTLLITYKRPLATFINATDQPDFPRAWDRYLTFRLAYELSFDYGVSPQEQAVLQKEFVLSREVIFPATRAKSDRLHDRATYF